MTRQALRMAHSLLLALLVLYQSFGTNSDIERSLHSLLRAIVGVVLSDFRFCSLSNMTISISLCIMQFLRHDLDHCTVYALSEAELLAWLLASLWAAQEVFRRLAENSLELHASLGAQRSMWKLLESQYNGVVHVGSDLCVLNASTDFVELLGVKTESGAAPDPPALDSGYVSPTSSIGSQALRGRPLIELLVSNSDRVTVKHRLETIVENVEDPHHSSSSSSDVEILQASLHNSVGETVPVSFHHSCFMVLCEKRPQHLICVRKREGSSSLSTAEPSGSRGHFIEGPLTDRVRQQNVASMCRALLDSMSQSAVLVFDIMDPELRIMEVSEKWTALFGVAEGNLPVWLGPRLVASFKEWVNGKLRDAFSGAWSQENSRHRFRKVAGRYPNGSKLSTTISLIMLNPAEYFSAEERSYLAVLLAESTGAHGSRTSSSRSSRSSGSRRNYLATVPEDPE
jgi:hypothetical protein